MDIADIGAVNFLLPPTAMSGVTSKGASGVAAEFNSLLMEEFVRLSGLAQSFAGSGSPEGGMVGDLMARMFASQLATQLHLVTAKDLVGTQLQGKQSK